MVISKKNNLTRRALGGAHVPPTKVFRRLTGSVNKTIVKPHVAAVANVYDGFSRCKIPHTSTYTIAEKAIWFWHLDYNPDRAQKVISSSMSRHLSTCNISSKPMLAFFSNLSNRQTDRQTRANAFTSWFVGGKNRVTFDKNWNVSCHMAKYCHNSCSKCPPFARRHMRRHPHHSSIALSMMVWSMPCQTCSKCCFISKHLEKIVCYLQKNI